MSVVEVSLPPGIQINFQVSIVEPRLGFNSSARDLSLCPPSRVFVCLWSHRPLAWRPFLLFLSRDYGEGPFQACWTQRELERASFSHQLCMRKVIFNDATWCYMGTLLSISMRTLSSRPPTNTHAVAHWHQSSFLFTQQPGNWSWVTLCSIITHTHAHP